MLMGFLLCKPDDWQIYAIQLVAELQESREIVGKVLKELVENGYATRKPIIEAGKRKGYDYMIYEVPIETVSGKPSRIQATRGETHELGGQEPPAAGAPTGFLR